MSPQEPCYISDDSERENGNDEPGNLDSDDEPPLTRVISAEDRDIFLRDDADVIQNYGTNHIYTLCSYVTLTA